MNTPAIINKHVATLMKLVGTTSAPTFVGVLAEPFAEVNFCFPNVLMKVKKSGGSIVYGWQIWEYAYCYEAEFHAVWMSPSGLLIDITPKSLPCNEILFIKDDQRTYNGRMVDNIRLKTRDNDLVEDLLALRRAKYNILNSGERADYTGPLTLRGNEALVLNYIFPIEQMLNAGMDNDSPCPCGSHKKHRDCHGIEVKQLIKIFA